MDLMNVLQLVLIVFLLLVTRYMSWKVNKYEGLAMKGALRHRELAIKYNHLVDDYKEIECDHNKLLEAVMEHNLKVVENEL